MRGELYSQPGLLYGYHFSGNLTPFVGGIPLVGTSISYPRKILGQACKTNGSTLSRVDCNYSDFNTPLKTGSFTVLGWIFSDESWANAVSLINRSIIISGTYRRGIWMGVGFNTTARPIIYRQLNDGSNHYVESDNSVSQSFGALAFTYDATSGETKIYWNGVLIKTGSLGTGDAVFDDAQKYVLISTYTQSPLYLIWPIGGIDELLIFSDVKDDAWHRKYYAWALGLLQEGGIVY